MTFKPFTQNEINNIRKPPEMVVFYCYNCFLSDCEGLYLFYLGSLVEY